MVVCKHVYYSGNVQGVGFRYTTERLAEGFNVSGYVRNLSNGEVELLAEGEEDEVDALLKAVANRMSRYIGGSRIENLVPSGQQGFRIRH